MILCAGEALIDMLPRQTEAGALAFAPFPGGAVMNTAIALARLGESTGFFSGLSQDLFGQQLSASLKANGVDTSRIALSDRPTTLAFVTLKDGQAEYAFYDENTAGRMLEPQDIPQDLTGISALFFGGISLAVEPCATAYETLCLAQAPERLVMVDPNIRAGFIVDEGRFRARIARMMAAADIIKVSDEDLHWLAGDGALQDLAEDLLEQGPALVCVTRGAEGVTGYTKSGAVEVAAEPVDVVDTVGAGDTFNAGLLASLSQAGLLNKLAIADLPEDALRDALSLGARAAAVTVGRAGANPPRLDELG